MVCWFLAGNETDFRYRLMQWQLKYTAELADNACIRWYRYLIYSSIKKQVSRKYSTIAATQFLNQFLFNILFYIVLYFDRSDIIYSRSAQALMPCHSIFLTNSTLAHVRLISVILHVSNDVVTTSVQWWPFGIKFLLHVLLQPPPVILMGESSDYAPHSGEEQLFRSVGCHFHPLRSIPLMDTNRGWVGYIFLSNIGRFCFSFYSPSPSQSPELQNQHE